MEITGTLRQNYTCKCLKIKDITAITGKSPISRIEEKIKH